MKLVAASHRIERWAIDPRGAARGVWHTREAIVIAVRTDEGLLGLGEAAPLPGRSPDSLADAAQAAEALAARLPIELASADDALRLAAELTTAPAARFAIETALLAALAQDRGGSIARLLVARPAREHATAIVVDSELEAAAATSRWLKLKTTDVDFIARVARAAPAARLRIDVNRGWTLAETPARLAALATLAIDFVEEPCRRAHELLGEPLGCKLALDESVAELPPEVLARALATPGLAAIVLKPTVLGGFARCLELGAAAKRHGVAPVTSHALEGAIAREACRALALALDAGVPAGLG